jgi:hypothetical protein
MLLKPERREALNSIAFILHTSAFILALTRERAIIHLSP